MRSTKEMIEEYEPMVLAEFPDFKLDWKNKDRVANLYCAVACAIKANRQLNHHFLQCVKQTEDGYEIMLLKDLLKWPHDTLEESREIHKVLAFTHHVFAGHVKYLKILDQLL